MNNVIQVSIERIEELEQGTVFQSPGPRTFYPQLDCILERVCDSTTLYVHQTSGQLPEAMVEKYKDYLKQTLARENKKLEENLEAYDYTLEYKIVFDPAVDETILQDPYLNKIVDQVFAKIDKRILSQPTKYPPT